MSEEKPSGKCVICGKPKTQPFRPFCSKRCADIDLHRWFSGGYAIEAEHQENDADDGSESPR
jgi:uncharacterized protein